MVARGGAVAFEERDVPSVGPRDILVRTTAASMCSADPAAASGSFDVVAAEGDAESVLPGIIIGHEAVGVVQEIGSMVTGFAVGDRAVSASTTPCGRCANCQRGFGGHCRGEMWGGYSPGVSRDGTLAEYFIVPDAEVNLAKVPDAVSDAGAVFISDSFSTGSTAIEETGLPLGGTVVVFGQGHIGLGAIAAASVAGAGLVIAVRSRAGSEDVAQRMGADMALNHAEHDVMAEILRLTDGVGVDLAVEASGSKAAFAQAIEATRLGGEISVIATYAGGDDSLTIPLPSWGWGVGDKTIRSRFQRSGGERTGRLLRLIERHRVDVTPVFTHEYSFDAALQAFADVRDGAPGLIKPLIRFN
ncbi:threonine dehydrogenase-like Zn-dependent dehydrogenase [Leucobacter exalbidus]|uniref:Threonine dehydrogenase-like Zn-dependent dehydrogenase n=1 Tax=Leucobacter exalbidus TaxID=662960 RepID=A0A940PX22_9MICO|nr:alcohol dehydrogenase catalytic domain-containing protein [Leucobacter exalbidus]MBP1326706.1 threonine dehydrogenase-like Zn-dependent dehydrogenase [Leucobacter exalbidus]